MNNEMKRRVFLSGIVCALVGTPVAFRLFSGKKKHGYSHRFSEELKKYRNIEQISIAPIELQESAKLTLAPPIGREWSYAFFSTTFYPTEFSTAIGHDPDSLFIREGTLFCDRTEKGQIVIGGGDQRVCAVTPLGIEERDSHDVTILVKNGGLVSAKPKGTEAPSNHSVQMPYLLALDLPDGNLSTGRQWRGVKGRLKPFVGYATEYKINGFAEVGGVRTVGIAFSGNIPNIADQPGVQRKQPESPTVSTNRHHGMCYFDLETGLLVRQEMELEFVNSGIKGYKGKDGADSVALKGRSIIQLSQS